MKGYCDNDHPLWVEKDGDGEGCLSWECPEHIRHSWTGERPVSPQTYSARVEAPDTERVEMTLSNGVVVTSSNFGGVYDTLLELERDGLSVESLKALPPTA